jgi:hypothetical protein
MMPELAKLFMKQSPGLAVDQQIVDGKICERSDGMYVKVDDSQALWGPVVGGTGLDEDSQVCVAVAQDGTIYVIYPGSGAGQGDCCQNIDGGKPDTVYGGMCNVDGNGVVRD